MDLSLGSRNYADFGSEIGAEGFVKNKKELEGSDDKFYPYTPFAIGRGASTNFGLNVGFSTGKKRQEVRFGVNYSRYSMVLSENHITATSDHLDSFQVYYPDQGPSLVYLDSVWMDKERLYYTKQLVSLSGEYIFRTERSRFSGFAGFGAQLGVSVHQNIQYSRYQAYRYEYRDDDGYLAFPNYSSYAIWPQAPYAASTNEIYLDGEHKALDAKMMFVFAPYLPIGIDYTPFYNRDFLSRFSIEAKGLIGTEFNMLSGAPVEINPFFGINWGVRYTLP